MVDRVTISDGETTLTMRKNTEFTIAPEEVSTSAVMASGRLVRDYTGYRNTISMQIWLSEAELALLDAMIRTTHELTVTYPIPGGDATGVFYFTLPKLTAFKYGAGSSVWYGVSLAGAESEVDTR